MRRVAADCLGIGADELSAGVSLTEDLAVDSLDLVDLAMALEAEFGIAVPDVVLDAVRSYGELVEAVEALVRGVFARVDGLTPHPAAKTDDTLLAYADRARDWLRTWGVHVTPTPPFELDGSDATNEVGGP